MSKLLTKKHFFGVAASTFVSVFLVAGFVFAAITFNANVQVGSGTPDLTLNGDDVYVNGTLEVNGNVRFDGTIAGPALTITATTTNTGLIAGANAFLFGGATGDEFETTLTITDPSADRTITFPNLTGTVSLITAAETLTNKTITTPTINGTLLTVSASSTFTGRITGASAFLFGGATADDFELTLTITDPTTDKTATIPDLNANDTFVFLAETQTLTNKTITTPTINGTLLTVSASSTFTGIITGASPFIFGGATADDFELTFAVTDPSADRTITFPNLTGTVSLITATETLTNKTIQAATLSATTTATGTFVQGKGADIAIAASGALGLGEDGNVFTITGVGTSTTVESRPAGTIITLIFTGTADSGGGLRDDNNLLNLASDFEYTPNDVITLVASTTSAWAEVTRSAN